MKIKEIFQDLSSTPLAKKGEKKETQGLDFQQLLKEANNKRFEAQPTSASVASPGESGMLSLPILSVPSLSGLGGIQDAGQIRSLGIQATESTLEVLERFQKAMAAPQVTLKQMDPIVQTLSREVVTLKDLSEKIPSSDPLQKIMNELGILSTVEIEKFRRGEYV
jgi:hypothetical protein